MLGHIVSLDNAVVGTVFMEQGESQWDDATARDAPLRACLCDVEHTGNNVALFLGSARCSFPVFRPAACPPARHEAHLVFTLATCGSFFSLLILKG